MASIETKKAAKSPSKEQKESKAKPKAALVTKSKVKPLPTKRTSKTPISKHSSLASKQAKRPSPPLPPHPTSPISHSLPPFSSLPPLQPKISPPSPTPFSSLPLSLLPPLVPNISPPNPPSSPKPTQNIPDSPQPPPQSSPTPTPISPSTTPSTSTPKRPICFNYEVPCAECIQPVSFGGLPSTYTIGEDIHLEYSLIEVFHPRAGDWVGLFRCCKDIEKCFEFAGFRWAQKGASHKNKPLLRTVTFYPNDIEVSVSPDDKYVFLYLSTNERILGQSASFHFKRYKVNEQSLAHKMVTYAVASAIQEMKKSSSIDFSVENLHTLPTQAAQISPKRSDVTEIIDLTWQGFTKVEKKQKNKRKSKEEKENDITFKKQTPKKNTPSHTTTTHTIPSLSNLAIPTPVPNNTPSSSPPSKSASNPTETDHVKRMVLLFEELIRRESEMKERMEKMEKSNLALILSQQLMRQQVKDGLHPSNCQCPECKPHSKDCQCFLCQSIGRQDLCRCPECLKLTHKLQEGGLCQECLEQAEKMKRHCKCRQCLERAAKKPTTCQCHDCMRAERERLRLQDSVSFSKRLSSEKKKDKKYTFGAKNLRYYHPLIDGDSSSSDGESGVELEERKRYLKDKLLEKVQRKIQKEENGLKIKKAVTEIEDLLKEMDREEEKVALARSMQSHSAYKHLLEMNFEEMKRKLKEEYAALKGKKRKSKTPVYSGSFIALNRLFAEEGGEKDVKSNKKSKNFCNHTFFRKPSKCNNSTSGLLSSALQATTTTTATTTKAPRKHSDIHKANYSIRLMYGNKHVISSSVPDMTLRKLFEDICSNEAVIVDVAKDRSILIQPFNTDDDAFCPISLASFPERNKATLKDLKAIKKKESSKKSKKTDAKSGVNLFTTTSNVLEELKERSRQEKILCSSSYPSRHRSSTKMRLEEIQQLLNSCFSNDPLNASNSISSQSSGGGRSKLSDLSMKVHRGSIEATYSPLAQSPAVTKLTLLDSFDILSSSFKETSHFNSRLKKDHSAKLLLITNILESNMTDENKILTLKQIMEACPLLSQIEKNSRKQFSPSNHKTRARFSDAIQTEHETSDSFCDVTPEEEDSFFKALKFRLPSRKPSPRRPTYKVANPLRRMQKSKRSQKKSKKSKYTQTENLMRKLSENEESEKQISNFPRLVRKPLPSILPMVLNTESKTSVDDESKMKPILKKPSPHALRPCHLSRKASLDFLNNLQTADFSQTDRQADRQADRQTDKGRHSDADEAGNFKRERKVSFNTIILTSLFENDDADKDDVGKKENISLVTSSGKDNWPIISERSITEAPVLEQFLELLEREVKVVSDNAHEIQNSIKKAVKIFKDEAINLKNKYSETLGKALRTTSGVTPDETSSPNGAAPRAHKRTQHDGKMNNVEELKRGVRPTKAMSIDRLNIKNDSVTSEQMAFGSLTNNYRNKVGAAERETSESNDEEAEDYPLLPVTRKTKHRAAPRHDAVKIYLRRELEIQMILDQVMKELKAVKIDRQTERHKRPECLKPYYLTDKKASTEDDEERLDEENAPSNPTGNKSSDHCSFRLSDYWNNKEAASSRISNDSLRNDQTIENLHTSPVVSLYSETSGNSMRPNSLARSLYSNGIQFPRPFDYDSQSISFPDQTNTSLSIMQSFDATISNIVKLYNNISNYVFAQNAISSQQQQQRSNNMEASSSKERDAIMEKSDEGSEEAIKHLHELTALALMHQVPSSLSKDYNDLVLSLSRKLSQDDSNSSDQRAKSLSDYEEMLMNITKSDEFLKKDVKSSSYASKTAKNSGTKEGKVVEVSVDDAAKETGKDFCLTCSEEFPTLKSKAEAVISQVKEEKKDGKSAQTSELSKNKKKKKKKD